VGMFGNVHQYIKKKEIRESSLYVVCPKDLAFSENNGNVESPAPLPALEKNPFKIADVVSNGWRISNRSAYCINVNNES